MWTAPHTNNHSLSARPYLSQNSGGDQRTPVVRAWHLAKSAKTWLTDRNCLKLTHRWPCPMHLRLKSMQNACHIKNQAISKGFKNFFRGSRDGVRKLQIGNYISFVSTSLGRENNNRKEFETVGVLRMFWQKAQRRLQNTIGLPIVLGTCIKNCNIWHKICLIDLFFWSNNIISLCLISEFKV